jgi:hypothetical protein
MLAKLAGILVVGCIFLGSAIMPAYGGQGVCCLCLQCPGSLPADCTLPLQADCVAACSALQCQDVTVGSAEECAAAPACPALVAPAPAAGGLALAGMMAVLVGVGASRILARKPRA